MVGNGPPGVRGRHPGGLRRTRPGEALRDALGRDRSAGCG